MFHFHPVGSQPPSVYWRRRLIMLGAVVLLLVLIVLTVRAAAGGSGGAKAGGSTSPVPPSSSSHVASTPAQQHSSSPPAHSSSSPAAGAQLSGASKTGSSAPPPPGPCQLANLSVAAVAGKSTYQVGDDPLLELQVTNVGTAPCVQDLADKQVELRVYNGESRVWGSHDCQVQPGTDDRTLAVNQPVLVAITWSGLSSQPSCAGTRQRVGAGTYTLYALLAGKTGKAAQFTIN